MTGLEKGIRALSRASPEAHMTLNAADVLPAAVLQGRAVGEDNAMKLSAVNACMEILSDSIGKLPIYFFDTVNRTRVNHELRRILCIRPNEAMTPFDSRKMLEINRLAHGNAYEWILRNRRTGKVEELIPIPSELVLPRRDKYGHMWYQAANPVNGEQVLIPGADMLHFKAYSRDGIKGISVLARAREAISAGLSAQEYNKSFYANGARPSGVLQTDSDISGVKQIKHADGSVSEIPIKDLIRTEWEKRYSGAANSFRTAILDHGLKYAPLAISNADAQFVEQQDLTVSDIARFFGVPLYKLQSGKQAYSSNEQNAIEYVVSKIHPITTLYSEEYSYKLLRDSELAHGLEIRINMMAELKGDTASRGRWYESMRNIGGFNANEIRELEDLPPVDGGEEYYASYNYAPLSKWAELSVKRAERYKE